MNLEPLIREMELHLEAVKENDYAVPWQHLQFWINQLKRMPDYPGEITAMYVRMKRGLYEDVEEMLEILHDPDLAHTAKGDLFKSLWGVEENYIPLSSPTDTEDDDDLYDKGLDMVQGV